MENTDILRAEIKSILAVKAKEGATYQDIKDDYADMIGKELGFDSVKEFNLFMRSMPDVYALRGEHGFLVWRSNSTKSKHIATMVENQKPPREQLSPLKRRVFYNSTTTCYYNDNYLYKNQRKSKSDSSLNEIRRGNERSRKLTLFYNHELIGDDFFLNIAHLDCRNKIDYIQTTSGYKGRPIKKCGHCISGQCIKDVTKMLKTNVKVGNAVILNIGSVDLLHGRDFIEMSQDFRQLYAEFEKRGIKPIITTLAPLANMCYSKEIQKRLQQFNLFLINNYENVLDITCCFVTNTQRVLFECYQAVPRYVSGSNQAHSLWNYVGRQRVIKYLKDSLAEISYRKSVLKNL